MVNHFFKEYFSFTQKERRGTLTLLLMIAGLIIIPFLFPLFIPAKKYDHSGFEKQIAQLNIQTADSGKHFVKTGGDDHDNRINPQGQEKNDYPDNKWQGTLFPFDPNTLDEKGWQKLGLKTRTIATIQNYLAKGGRFKEAEDIKKIWGLTEEFADKLMPYVQIGNEEHTAPTKPVYEKEHYRIAPVDINSADSTALDALPGIGFTLARRIIAFREKLGGFYAVEQVKETFGLPDSIYQKIKPRLVIGNTTLKQLNINTVSFDALKNHPYCRFAVANAIIQYRNQHGNFNSLPDLKKVVAVTDEVYNKLLPYLHL